MVLRFFNVEHLLSQTSSLSCLYSHIADGAKKKEEAIGRGKYKQWSFSTMDIPLRFYQDLSAKLSTSDLVFDKALAIVARCILPNCRKQYPALSTFHFNLTLVSWHILRTYLLHSTTNFCYQYYHCYYTSYKYRLQSVSYFLNFTSFISRTTKRNSQSIAMDWNLLLNVLVNLIHAELQHRPFLSFFRPFQQ